MGTDTARKPQGVTRKLYVKEGRYPIKVLGDVN